MHWQHGSQYLKTKKKQKLVYGPALFALPGVKFDNSLMYVVQNVSDHSQYAVAIRGTNPMSLSNIILWDAMVDETRIGYSATPAR